ncbi:MAG TPA: SDR family NAD(P)-dependent oxidoreductase [Dehalococcoidia bacterium]|nr:SDR family NAD(P)-dependent oxidoreductase [Dehalococcoidia bacterium]
MTGMGSLQGAVAIVSGGASGIGRAIACRLARDGARVAVLDLNGAGAEQTLQQIAAAGGGGLAVTADVSRAAAVQAAVARVRSELGEPEILVSNAGIARAARVAQIAEADWDRVLETNLKACYLLCREITPGMAARRGGRIVAIASGTAVRVGPGNGAYGASKAGLIALIKAVAAELAPDGVTANIVAPGITDTPMTRAIFGGEEALRRQASSGRIANPMRVVIEPEDIAAAVAFLAGPEARYITGQTLHVNAGAFMP